MFAQRKLKSNCASRADSNPSPAEQECPVLANSVDSDQLASEANWSWSALFVIKYVILSKTRIK